jgi:hypothetical protein
MIKFDIFIIREFEEGFFLQLGISRPSNSPKYRRTNADRNRSQIVLSENIKLAGKMFKSEKELVEVIRKYRKGEEK